MHKKPPKLGPIGKGFVQEVKTKDGTRYVARWNAFVLDESGERKRIQCGPHELGPKVAHGPGLKNLKQAKDGWGKTYWSVFQQHHPETISPAATRKQITPNTTVRDFISSEWEPRRRKGWEDNTRINWEYYRDSFINPFFGDHTLADMNQEAEIERFMAEIGDREFSDWVAKKAYTYVKALLDTASNLGVIRGNAAKLIPKNRRTPKGVKKTHHQPFVTVDDFVKLFDAVSRPRDRIILKVLFLCAVRRSEFLVLKWKDFVQDDGRYTFTIQRSFDSRTHKIKEWNPDLKAHGKVAVPPQLACEIEGWRKYGDTNGTDPESFIFPTRNGTCIIPTNWSEDVLKPAGAKAGILGVSYHWFRRGHATVQHHGGVQDKPIQGQLRHSKAEVTRNVYMQQVDAETWKAVVDLESKVNAKREAKAANA
jgi:integrase